MGKWGERVIKVCQHCNKEFQVKPNAKAMKQVFCCVECLRRSRITLPIAICKWCSREFQPKFADRISYCSNECKDRYKAAVKVSPKGDRLAFSKVSFAACKMCGKWFRSNNINSIVCSSECGKADARSKWHVKKIPILEKMRLNYIPKPLGEKTCIVCGKHFMGKARYKTCSDACGKSMGDSKPRKRARIYGVQYQPINVISVFDRDGWTCQICGKKTPSKLRGTMKANAPELDHRVPISKGGGHTYDNVQCACRGCNGIKGNKNSAGQMPLFHNLNEIGGA